MIEVKRELVEAAKMALKTAMNRNVIVSDTTVQSIQYLAGLYESTGDDDYLLSAYAMIQAYVELGYRYERCQKEFDQILKKCKTSYEIEFGGMYFSAGEVRLTKPQIRLLLGRCQSNNN